MEQLTDWQQGHHRLMNHNTYLLFPLSFCYFLCISRQ